MGTEPGRIFGLAYKQPAYLTEEDHKQLRQQLLIFNIKRERILSIVLIFFLSIIIGSILLSNDSSKIDSYLSRDSIFIHFALIVLSVLFLIRTYGFHTHAGFNFIKLYFLHRVIIFTVLLLCAVIAVNNEALNQRPFAYIIAIYSVASMVLLEHGERLFAYIISYIVYILGSVYFIGLSWRIVESIVFSLPLLVLALLVSSVNYSAAASNFKTQQLIEEKNKQLDKMCRTVEETLVRRTEQLNQAMELDKLRAVFFANISHELRTPLNVIYSAEQILSLIFRNENIQNRRLEIERYNDMIQQNCYRMIRLIENLIDITEIDAGQTQLKLEWHNIARLVEVVTMTTADYFKHRNIKLEFKSSPEDLYIACDGSKVQRIILNLLSNAVKFTPENGVIQVNFRQELKKALIQVSDTGIGIPKEMRESIFDPFVRVDKSTSRMREGSGIGLSIVKAFTEMHRGEIHVLSEEGRGSTFIVELPTDLQLNVGKPCTQIIDYHCDEKIKMEFSDFYN